MFRYAIGTMLTGTAFGLSRSTKSKRTAWEKLFMKRFLVFTPCFLLLLATSHLARAQTVIFLTSGSSWTVPSDWNSSDNTIEVIGSGGEHRANPSASGGNGGGSYSRISNLALTPNSMVSFQVGVSGIDALHGAATWFNGTSISNASVSAAGGCSTTSTTNCANNISSNVGSLINKGGKGGNTATSFTSGGGGAAGPNGNGDRGSDSGTTKGGAGGAGDAGFGGAGGPGSIGGLGNGGSGGTEYTASNGDKAGSGGGGGGAAIQGGTGGGYGGGAAGSTTSVADPGAGGLIVITYTP
jgi:hypothetical protein